jgi:hypothetical protein
MILKRFIFAEKYIVAQHMQGHFNIKRILALFDRKVDNIFAEKRKNRKI